MKNREKREFALDWSGISFGWLLIALLALALGSCALVRPEPMDPLLVSSPALQLDSLGEPVVNYRRPDYARSMPWARGDAGVLAGLLPGSQAKKDKRRITIYNAPATGRGSTVVVGNDNAVADNSKAQAPAATGAVATAADSRKGRGNATGPAAQATAPPDTGPAWWVCPLLVVLGLLIAFGGLVFWLVRTYKPFG